MLAYNMPEATYSTICDDYMSYVTSRNGRPLDSYQVFHQVIEWRGVTVNSLEWGWIHVNDLFVPIQPSLEPTHRKLLEMVHCHYKTWCKSGHYTCRWHVLEISSPCVTCHGVSCENCQKVDLELNEDNWCTNGLNILLNTTSNYLRKLCLSVF